MRRPACAPSHHQAGPVCLDLLFLVERRQSAHQANVVIDGMFKRGRRLGKPARFEPRCFIMFLQIVLQGVLHLVAEYHCELRIRKRRLLDIGLAEQDRCIISQPHESRQYLF